MIGSAGFPNEAESSACGCSPLRPVLCLVPSVTKSCIQGRIFDRGVAINVWRSPDKDWQKDRGKYNDEQGRYLNNRKINKTMRKIIGRKYPVSQGNCSLSNTLLANSVQSSSFVHIRKNFFDHLSVYCGSHSSLQSIPHKMQIHMSPVYCLCLWKCRQRPWESTNEQITSLYPNRITKQNPARIHFFKVRRQLWPQRLKKSCTPIKPSLQFELSEKHCHDQSISCWATGFINQFLSANQLRKETKSSEKYKTFEK